MSVFYTGDWHPLGQDYYRKVELYTMGWTNPQVDVENCFVVGAPYGGPLATVRDEKRVVRVTPGVSVKPIISIYTAAGGVVSSIKWDSGTLVKMGWSSTEDLLCIQEDGNILVYDYFGKAKETVKCQLGGELKEKAYEAEIFPSASGTGVAYLTNRENFLLLSDHRHARVKKLPRLPEPAPGDPYNKITAWAVISTGTSGKSQHKTSVLVARGSNLFLLTASDCLPVTPEWSSGAAAKAAINSIGVSINGLHVALLTESGHLYLGSSDWSRKYCEVTVGLRARPRQLVWCGSKSVALSWENSLLLVSTRDQGASLTFTSDSCFALVAEIDCVRLVGNTSHEILQRVPVACREIFEIGSVSEGSVLLEASKRYIEGSYKADEYVRMIRDMRGAVEQVLTAAGHEFYPPTQKMLLKAAQFGKSFLTKYSPEPYVHMCKMLRVLNAVKDYKVGMPLTYTQLEKLESKVLIDRLVLRRQYALAIKIADFLKLNASQGRSRILAHWACYKVAQTHVEEGRLAAEIYSKLKADPHISYSEIANKASEAGRKRLALNLAKFESRRSVQVPLFLRLGDRATALHNAVESGDSNIIYDVILDLRSSMPLSEFQMLIRKYPMAQNLYLKYCRVFSPESVRDVYEQEDDFSGQATLFLQESAKEGSIAVQLSALVSAQEMYKKGKNDFLANLCEEQHRLLKYQQQWDQQFNLNTTKASLRDTLKALLAAKQTKVADKLRSEFRVSDKMYWSIKLQTAAELGDWAELDKLAKGKKTPGGFEEFVEVCLQHGSKEEAHKYLKNVREELQVKYYCMAGYFKEAAQLAFDRRNEDDLRYVRLQCLGTDRVMADQIAEMVEQLRLLPPEKGSSRR